MRLGRSYATHERRLAPSADDLFQGLLERRAGGVAVHGEDHALEAAARRQVAPDLGDLDRRRLASGKPPTPVPNATSASERAPSSSALASVAAVARRMMSAEVGPPSTIVAAWMTQRAGMSPALVSTASPRPIGALRVALALHRAPPAREIAPATPPPWAQLGVRRVGDRVDRQRRDVAVEDLDDGHDGALARLRPARRCPAGARGRAARRR